jgi:hypothetical protein
MTVKTSRSDTHRLKLIRLNVKRTVEVYSDKPIQIGEAWRHDAEIFLADVINSIVVDLDD